MHRLNREPASRRGRIAEYNSTELAATTFGYTGLIRVGSRTGQKSFVGVQNMSAHDSVAELMTRLRAGEDGAAREVFVRFAGRLVGLARRHLDARLAVKVDPEDVVQSAYKSFFVRQRDGGLEVGSWDGLWGVLTVITLRKCADRAAYYSAGKRDVSREMGGGFAPDDSGPVSADLVLDREPRPDEAAVLAETVEALYRTLDDADERAILELSLQGYSASEVSERLGRAERSVRRLREGIRKRLERMQVGEA